MQVEPAKMLQTLSNLKFKPKINFRLYEANQLQSFFSIYRLRCYVLLLLSLIGLGASAYLFTASFETDSTGLGIILFLVGLLFLLPWTLVPALFLFTTFRPKTWQRKVSWGYVGALVISFAFWIYYFD